MSNEEKIRQCHMYSIKYGYKQFRQQKKECRFIHQNIEQNVYQLITDQFACASLSGLNHQWNAKSCPLFVFVKQKKSIAEVIKQFKGNTSHYINQQNLIAEKFAWQTGYAAYSVSESVINRVY